LRQGSLLARRLCGSEAIDPLSAARVIASGVPRRLGKALRGDKGEFWSYRVGNYRIICLIEDKRLVVWSSRSAIGAT
jgi:hypothetical protein